MLCAWGHLQCHSYSLLRGRTLQWTGRLEAARPSSTHHLLRKGSTATVTSPAPLQKALDPGLSDTPGLEQPSHAGPSAPSSG